MKSTLYFDHFRDWGWFIPRTQLCPVNDRKENAWKNKASQPSTESHRILTPVHTLQIDLGDPEGLQGLQGTLQVAALGSEHAVSWSLRTEVGQNQWLDKCPLLAMYLLSAREKCYKSHWHYLVQKESECNIFCKNIIFVNVAMSLCHTVDIHK